MADTTNICGVAVYLAPGAAGDLTSRILAMPGVELEAAAGENRLALTVIDTPASLAIDQIAAMHRLPGVVSASLIFHAFDTSDDESAVETGPAACCGGDCENSGAHARASTN
ncbi:MULTISPECIES: chaperone NapD [Bradyrhizobium]|uniref:chaperone NapD n=1 Tax=Bradyrhizobium TaxID=374 RepID=UPI000C1DE09B|nr:MULTISPECIES: chaperone NapD [Bradyrhizobium]